MRDGSRIATRTKIGLAGHNAGGDFHFGRSAGREHRASAGTSSWSQARRHHSLALESTRKQLKRSDSRSTTSRDVYLSSPSLAQCRTDGARRCARRLRRPGRRTRTRSPFTARVDWRSPSPVSTAGRIRVLGLGRAGISGQQDVPRCETQCTSASAAAIEQKTWCVFREARSKRHRRRNTNSKAGSTRCSSRNHARNVPPTPRELPFFHPIGRTWSIVGQFTFYTSDPTWV